MADIVNTRPTPRYGGADDIFPPIYGPIGIAANTLMLAGAMVGTDNLGNMVSADLATCQQVVGVSRRTYFNRNTDPSGGAAGAVQGEILAGCFPFFINTDGGAITNANRWQDVFVSDNQTVSLLGVTAAGVTRLPAGYLVAIDTLGGPTNGLAWVQVGEPNPNATPRRISINLSLAQIQAQASGVAFTVATLPPNAYLQNAEIINTATFTGGGITTMTATLQGGADAAGSIIASGTVLTLGNVNAAPGSNPYQKRAGQAIKLTLTEGVGTLATLTGGSLQIDLFCLVIP